jgi:hypothetical protein
LAPLFLCFQNRRFHVKQSVYGLILAAAMTGQAHAEVKKEHAQMFCGPVKEVEAMITDYDKILEGEAGEAGTHGIGEVWLNIKTSEWFFIQRDEKNNVSCVVLGGGKFKHSIAGQGL